MKRRNSIFALFLGLAVLTQTAIATPMIESGGWKLETTPATKNAFLFVKINGKFWALPHYSKRAIEYKVANQPLKVEGIVVKLGKTILGVTCKNTIIKPHEKLIIKGKVVIDTQGKPDFSKFTCKIKHY